MLFFKNLRFNGFDDGWQDTTLNDIATFTKGKDISKNDISDEGIECVRYGELYTKYGELIYDIDSKTNLNKNELILSNKNDILIPCSGETAIDLATASCIQKENVAIGGDITIIQTNQYAPFITYYLNQKKNEIARFAQGVSIVHLYSKDFKALKMKIPSINEQKKIISLLEIITNKEQLLKQKYQYYQNFKKYLMQQIFAQKLRFNFDEEWVEIKLRDIGTFYRGHSYNSGNVVDNGLLVLRSNNIQDNALDFSDSELQFVNKDCKKELELQKNDIVICMSNGTRSLVGKSAQYLGNYNKKLTVGAFCSIFRTNNILAKYLFQTELYRKNLYLILAGTNINNLKNSDLEKFKFKIPNNKTEIKKIHDLFSSVDMNIENIKNQLNEIKLFKKSLLQQMFV
ncbi:restriction endonuclease subunit S [uncultured Methanobrevibacter sp.]|uniref:restriction endonuclease subunit S n=1 Tax=uncultured Methanobrevibacter sp. TaxID=253161 RepID=UPI0032093966